jgi:hypothetical protein
MAIVRQVARQFRTASGDSITLHLIDHGIGWIDVVRGDGDPYALNSRSTDDAEVIATARRINGRAAWVVEGFGGHSDFLPNKKIANDHLLALICDELGGQFSKAGA